MSKNAKAANTPEKQTIDELTQRYHELNRKKRSRQKQISNMRRKRSQSFRMRRRRDSALTT